MILKLVRVAGQSVCLVNSGPDHATLDSGWWPAFTGQDSHLLGRVEGFRHVCSSREAPKSAGSSGEIMVRVVCVLNVEETGIPALELRPERVIEHPGWRRNSQAP